MKKKIQILDCTLRDGGYYNNWNFSLELISDYIDAAYSSGVNCVELGFRSLNYDPIKGPCAYTSDNFLDIIRIPKKLQVSVMINASEFSQYNFNLQKKKIRKLFAKKNKSKVSIIRVATHINEINKITKLINYLKILGYKIAINLMQISEYSDQKIEEITKIISATNTDILYVADSLGSLNEENVKNIFEIIKKNWKKELGFHAHDNLNRALSNTSQAFQSGCSWIDGTVLGMGRGAGNAKIEFLVTEYSSFLKEKSNIIPLLNLIDKYFQPLMNKYQWGPNFFYFLSGMKGVHPTYIQTMLSNPRFKYQDILSTVSELKKLSKEKIFIKDVLQSEEKLFPNSKLKGTWIAKKVFNNNNVLIIGNGPQIKNYQKIIEKYIYNTKPIVIGLNTQKTIDEKLINFRVISHELRIVADRRSFKKIKQPVIVPCSRISLKTLKYFKKSQILNFGMIIENSKFKFKNNYAVVPNSLVFSYALAVIKSGNCKNIFLAGFDGFSSEDPRNLEMNEVISLFKKYSKKNIFSITPSTYQVEKLNIF
jgi:4-hydroxy 2-oxovalerate aldolase